MGGRQGKVFGFYAYYLDQQNATFQAWARRGPDSQQALSLGIFYSAWVSFIQPGYLL
jgi:hypothetical protein